MTSQEALVVITIEQLITLQTKTHSSAGLTVFICLQITVTVHHVTTKGFLTLPTLAASSLAFSRTKMTPCDVEATASSSASMDGAVRPPTMSAAH